MDLTTANNLLVIKNRAMGDALMGLGALSYIKKMAPHLRITYAIPEWIVPLFKNVNSDADEILSLKLQSFSNFIKTYKQLSEKKIDAIFELHLSGRTHKFFSIYSLINRCPYHYHNHHLQIGPILDQGVIKPLIQRDLDGIYSTYFSNTTPPSYLDHPPRLKINRTPENKRRIILGIVATRETKIWPLEKFAKLAKELANHYPEYQLIVPLSKSSFDQSLKETLTRLTNNLPAIHFLEVPLDELPLYLNGAQAYIGNDTGLKHLSIALGIPTVTLFGPEPPLEWHPYETSKNPYLFIEPLSCRTLKSHYCNLNHCKSMICLKDISVEQVLKKVKVLI